MRDWKMTDLPTGEFFKTLWTHLVNCEILRDPLRWNILIHLGACDQSREGERARAAAATAAAAARRSS